MASVERQPTDPAGAIRRYFRDHRPAGVTSVYLYGSHARREPHAETDVDVGLVLDRTMLPDRPARGRLALRLASDLIAATHANEVQVVALNDVSPELAAVVLREGERLYCADEVGDRDFVRTVLLRAADLRPFLERTRETKLRALRR